MKHIVVKSATLAAAAIFSTWAHAGQPVDSTSQFEAIRDEVILTRHLDADARARRLSELERTVDACTILTPDDRSMLLFSMAQRLHLASGVDFEGRRGMRQAAALYERSSSLATQLDRKVTAAAEATRAFDVARDPARAVAVGRAGLELWRSSPNRNDPKVAAQLPVLVLHLASALAATGDVDGSVTLLRETGEDATFPWGKPMWGPYALFSASRHLDAAGRLDEARQIARRAFDLARERSVDDAGNFLISALKLEWRGQSDRQIFSSALEHFRDPWVAEQTIAFQLGLVIVARLGSSGMSPADRSGILDEVIRTLEPIWNRLDAPTRERERQGWTEICVGATVEHIESNRFPEASAMLARAQQIASDEDRREREEMFRSLGQRIDVGLARMAPAENPR